MKKRASIAVSALLSLSANALSAAAATPDKSVALMPHMVPTSPAPHLVNGVTRPVNVDPDQLKRLAMKAYPHNRMQRGLYLLQKGSPDSALIEFLKAAQEDPTQVRAFYEQALIFKQKGYTKLAQSSLQQALAVNPNFKDARVLLASIYLESGDVSQAAQELFASLGMNPKKPVAPKAEPETANDPPASIAQTPHGTVALPIPSSSTPEPAARPQTRLQTETISPFSNADGQTKVAAVPVEGARTIADLLKGIPGLDPEAKGPEATPTPKPTSPPATPSLNPPANANASTNDAPKDVAQATTPIVVKPNEQQLDQLLKQVKKQNSHGFKIGLPLPWFSSQPSEPKAAPMPKLPPQPKVEQPKVERTKKVPPVAAIPQPATHSEPVKAQHTEQVTTPREAILKAQAEDAADAGDSQQDDSPAEQQERKHRPQIATWISSLLDGGNVSSTPAPPPVVPQPVKPQAVEQPKKQAKKQPEPLLAAKPVPAPQPLDVSKLLKRAVCLMPLPVFKPTADYATGAKPPMPVPKASTQALAAAPPVLQPTANQAPAPLPQPQAHAEQYGNWCLPALPRILAMHSLPGTAKESQSTNKAEVAPHNPRQTFPTNVLIGELAPVLATAKGDSAAPPLQRVDIKRTEGNSAPSPIPMFTKNLYYSLVTARFGPPPVTPVPIAPSRQATSAPLPVANALPTAEAIHAPKPTSLNIATAGMAPIPVAATPVVIPAETLAPTASLSAPTSLPAAPNVPRVAVTASPAAPKRLDSAPAPSFFPSLPIPEAIAHLLPTPQPVVTTPTSSTPVPISSTSVPETDSSASVAPVRMDTDSSSTPVALVPVSAPPPKAVPQEALKLSHQGFKFVAPQLTVNQKQLMSSLHKLKAQVPREAPLTVKQIPKLDNHADDHWTTRMKYLLSHGTQTLAYGEAFMFSEETGEGVIFLSDHTSIRRKIAAPQSSQQVAMLRRPDIAQKSGELQYNLSLLGKIIKPKAANSQHVTQKPAPVANGSASELLEQQSQNFLGWIKDVFQM